MSLAAPPLSRLAWSALMRLPWPETVSPAFNFERGYHQALSVQQGTRRDRRTVELEIALRQLLDASRDTNSVALDLAQGHAALLLEANG